MEKQIKRYLLLAISIAFVKQSLFAQDIHIFNKFSSQPKSSEASIKRIDSIPFFKSSYELKSKSEVSYVDNSKLSFFPPIFNQIGNSCSQASGIRNVFTYEMNFERNQAASNSYNIYSYHYTWNFLNQGRDYGSWYFDGFSIVQDNGVPCISDFPDESSKTTEKTWMSGYDKYYRAMKNRIESFEKIDAESAGGLALIKQYLIDHGNGSKEGGLIVFSGKSTGWDMISYTGPSNTHYSYAIRTFGDGGDHAMTIVGFDDAVCIDVNKDGSIQDDEKGALIIVNTWGSGWGSNGRAYISYKLLKMNWYSGGIGNGDHYVYVLKAKDHTPKVTAKLSINYTSRNDLWFILGVAKDANAEVQEKTKIACIIQKQGGDVYMRGTTDELGKTIEVGLDFSNLIESIPDAKKFFITIKQSLEGDLGTGKIISFSILDYRDDVNPKEYICPDKNVTIAGNTALKVSIPSTEVSCNVDNSSLKVFPNPVQRGETINIAGLKADKAMIELVNLFGQIIHSEISTFSINKENYSFFIPSGINPGVYIIRIQGAGTVQTQSICIN